ncbi:MAG: DinB family protein [Bacteroidia bacterium]|nr:DinB family protein [Bacteroidia bacterium]
MPIPPPIDAVPQLYELDRRLLDLLRALTPEDWNAQTVARLWKVRDAAAHLLDGNIRILSLLRDQHHLEAPEIRSYEDLVAYLNGLNASWVQAMRRVSPQMLIQLHELTGPQFCDYYASLDPWVDAAFSVAWAGEQVSQNWFHIAREYTEKFLHQQQIRDATGRPGILTQELFGLYLDIQMRGLPHTFRATEAPAGTRVRVRITGGGIRLAWDLLRQEAHWALVPVQDHAPDAELQLPPDPAWKLFSKSLRPADVMDQAVLLGEERLARQAMELVAVMA